MGRPRTWTDRQLRRAVLASKTWEEVAGRLRLAHANPSVTRRARELGLDTSHFLRVGVIDTRPYATEVLGDAIYDEVEEHEPGTHLRSIVAKMSALRARRDHQVRVLYRRGMRLKDIAHWAELSVPEVAEIVRPVPDR